MEEFKILLKKAKFPVDSSRDANGATHATDDSMSSWMYFKTLNFLKDQMKYRKSSSGNLKRPEKVDSSTLINEQSDELDSICLDSFQENITSEKRSKKLKKIIVTDNSELIEIEKRKLELLEKQKRRDEDESFFDSLLPHIRKLQQSQKLLCRMEIQNIVYSHVYKTSQRSNSLNLIRPYGSGTTLDSRYSLPQCSPLSGFTPESSGDTESPLNCVSNNDFYLKMQPSTSGVQYPSSLLYDATADSYI